tara:strand:+ start:6195 stop:7022 length:828 start_codon:yes stop_codon:yes gene_type:complete
MISDFKGEYICGRKSQAIADKVWDTDRTDSIGDLKDKSIIWCVRKRVEELFIELNRHPYKKVVLVTCNGDWCVDEKLFQKKSECVKVWFSQNVDYKHSALFHFPIGLENDFGPSKGRYTDYQYLIGNVNSDVNDCYKDKSQLYCNFNVKNNVNYRSRALRHLGAIGLDSSHRRKSYIEYCEDISKHMFIMSPNGNGIDCHRTWESLYMGSVPVVQSHFMFDGYRNLPIIQVDAVEDINADWIREKVEWYNSSFFSYEELKMSYWLEKITKECFKL